jgi:hypothetical protein
MLRKIIIASFVAAATLLAVPAAHARVGVEVWTDRGQDAVYQPGEVMQVKVRTSGDSHLLVYEIDTEGNVRVLFPFQGQSGFVEGKRTLQIPPAESNVELAVEAATGEGYIVALATAEPFLDLPWYLLPYDPHSEGIEYEGKPEEQDGVGVDGRIVGDPFVAMERIRRRIVRTPDDANAFGTAYASYYVHEQVKYPRYLCNDCHRPGHYAWWDGFDPYYATCSVIDFRINWGWAWGPTYWFGYTPYYCYVLRPGCPPYWGYSWYNPYYSSWDGWTSWNTMWGGPLVRYKSPPPPDYVPPNKFSDPDRWRGRDGVPTPPGYLARGTGGGVRQYSLGLGRNRLPRSDEQGAIRMTGSDQRGQARPLGRPGGEVLGGVERRVRPVPAYTPRGANRPADSGGERGTASAPSGKHEDRGGRSPSSPPSVEKPHQDPPKPQAPPKDHQGGESRTPPSSHGGDGPRGGDGQRGPRGDR